MSQLEEQQGNLIKISVFKEIVSRELAKVAAIRARKNHYRAQGEK